MVKMQNKELLFNDQARSAIKSGIDILADAVKVTLGPNGRCVILGEYKKIGTPHITKDGVTILADSFEAKDEIDLSRAEESKARAECRLKSKGENIDVARAEIALRKAINRIKIASK